MRQNKQAYGEWIGRATAEHALRMTLFTSDKLSSHYSSKTPTHCVF